MNGTKKCEHNLKNISYRQAYSVTNQIILYLHAIYHKFGLVNHFRCEMNAYRNKYNFFVIQSRYN